MELDRILDFQNNIDTLVLDTALWGGGELSVGQLSAYASLTEDGHVSLDFGNGNTLELTNIDNINVLNDDLGFQ